MEALNLFYFASLTTLPFARAMLESLWPPLMKWPDHF